MEKDEEETAKGDLPVAPEMVKIWPLEAADDFRTNPLVDMADNRH
jgi:hypothetical protein